MLRGGLMRYLRIWIATDSDVRHQAELSLPVNCPEPDGPRAQPKRVIRRIRFVAKRLADLREVDKTRLQHWQFARAAADPRPDLSNVDVARILTT